jgi:hypothetical protein
VRSVQQIDGEHKTERQINILLLLLFRYGPIVVARQTKKCTTKSRSSWEKTKRHTNWSVRLLHYYYLGRLFTSLRRPRSKELNNEGMNGQMFFIRSCMLFQTSLEGGLPLCRYCVIVPKGQHLHILLLLVDYSFVCDTTKIGYY